MPHKGDPYLCGPLVRHIIAAYSSIVASTGRRPAQLANVCSPVSCNMWILVPVYSVSYCNLDPRRYRFPQHGGDVVPGNYNHVPRVFPRTMLESQRGLLDPAHLSPGFEFISNFALGATLGTAPRLLSMPGKGSDAGGPSVPALAQSSGKTN